MAHYRRTDVPSDRASDYPDRNKPAGKPIESGGLGPVRILTAEEIAKAREVCDSFNHLGGDTEAERLEWLSDVLHALGLR